MKHILLPIFKFSYGLILTIIIFPVQLLIALWEFDFEYTVYTSYPKLLPSPYFKFDCWVRYKYKTFKSYFHYIWNIQ
jgi:hypothetical protein